MADADSFKKNEDDEPVVFSCVKCKLLVGDSLSWVGSETNQSQILLSRVTDNVLTGEETVYEPTKKAHCLTKPLFCRGCKSELGMTYISTPKSLDYKRFIFFFNVEKLDSYVLGSANQVGAKGYPNKEPVTMEYRNDVEQQLIQMKTLMVSMAQKLEYMETSALDDTGSLLK
ncbi:protein Mis18-alpha [Lampris incognitus]|uniref:protein Mis18-alpha n=1 Tax=Lampris incognitus TaxID=2546036 RepID=UPI0024B5D8BB|nr:protein Mis18-alpha [Lampris incognitus]